MWGNQTAHGSASTDLAPAFSRIPLLELPRSVPSRVRIRTCSMRCAPQFLALPQFCNCPTLFGTSLGSKRTGNEGLEEGAMGLEWRAERMK